MTNGAFPERRGNACACRARAVRGPSIEDFLPDFGYSHLPLGGVVRNAPPEVSHKQEDGIPMDVQTFSADPHFGLLDVPVKALAARAKDFR